MEPDTPPQRPQAQVRARLQEWGSGLLGRAWRRWAYCSMGLHQRCRDMGLLDGRDPAGWVWCLDCGGTAEKWTEWWVRVHPITRQQTLMVGDGQQWQLGW